ncbi:vanadium-dependent haloperoxidase [Solirubrobacter soli]|uniref:vanadium-dependent haloperoxidase n=1 Tax=Solirubrobacter soli TaxID=363832 RepID=UPI00040C6874|nr:vanadium-dependent haloperoxidase [Solirubrobacter soli]
MTRRLGLLAAVVGSLLVPCVARADTVTDWNEIASSSIVGTAGQPPPVSALSFAMVQGAVYDAVNAIDRRHRPYLVAPPARRTDSEDAAAATAAFRVLVALFPTQQATLQARYEASMAAVADIPAGARAGGIAVGEAAAAAMLAARADDGRFSPFTIPIGTTPGAWRPTPPAGALDPAPWVGNVRPFLVGNAQWLRSRGPNALTSRAYARDFNEIKTVGALHSTTRTADQTDAAIFWQEPIFGLFNRIFRTLAADRRLGEADSARLFAITDLAAADAAIGCWNDKYHWNFWRPITAIREAAGDGNPATEADPAWLPLFDPATPVAAQPPLVTPPFPDHPSGHNCATGAIVPALQRFFGTDHVAFSATSTKSGTTRSFTRLSDVLREMIDARVWAGIHFRTADIQGARLGAKVARYEHLRYGW